MNSSAFGVEKATLIRVPATANLMVDSFDRDNIVDASGVDLVSPWNFQIARPQALINGFFSRVGVTEVVLEWCLPNISESLGNYQFGIRDSSGADHVVELSDGNYTVENALNTIEALLTAEAIPGYTWTIANDDGIIALDGGGTRTFAVLPNELSYKLGLNPTDVINNQALLHLVQCPDLRPYRYLDFVCSQLTAVQDVKDAATDPAVRDVLVRWYFAYDEQNLLDGLGFPILMGYTKFITRRLYNPPKQIKWEQNLPVGNLTFEVYSDLGQIVKYESPSYLNTPDRSNWLMTLQLSEG